MLTQAQLSASLLRLLVLVLLVVRAVMVSIWLS